MLPHALYLVAMLGLDCVPTQPPRPDFEALVPPARVWSCPRKDWVGYAQRRYEAHALARYLTRCWGPGALGERAPDAALNALAVVQQFEASLCALEPNPTVADAVARVRAYRPVLAFAREQLRNGPEEEPKPGRLWQLPAQVERFQKHMRDRYGSLFARSV